MAPRVFLDIDIGDSEVHAQYLAQFEATLRFFEQSKAQLGLSEDAALDSLDADGQDLLIEAFQSRNASVSSKTQLMLANAKVPAALMQDGQHDACAG